MNRKVQAAGETKKPGFIVFLFALLFVAPLVCCNKKTTQPPPPMASFDDIAGTWSPDGRTIAYVHSATWKGADTISGIYLVDTSGMNERLLVQGSSVFQPSFSPDGNWIVFSGNASIWKIKLNGDSLSQIVQGDDLYRPDWSPDGQYIIYNKLTGGENGIWIVRMEGGNGHRIIPFGMNPCWSSDGERILSDATFFENGAWQSYVVIFNRPDSGFKKITKYSFPTWQSFRWKPDQSKIVFDRFCSQRLCPTFMDTLGQIIGPNLDWAQQVSWSPDGRKIVYTDTRPGVGRIVISNEDGTEKKQLSFPK